jgi:RimJ/RimL family protein N-acetyltransferase
MNPIIETERLILRMPVAEDFEAYARFMGEAATAQFVGGVQPRAVAWRGFVSIAGAWAIQGFSMFTVIDKASGDWAGRVGPWVPEGWPGTEVGWGIDARFQGRGYAVEAAAASMDWAVETFGWTDIIHCIAPDNHPSQGVARKLGAVNRGPGRLPEPFADAVIDLWGQTAADWAANPLSRL